MNNDESKSGVGYLARLEHFHQLDKEREDMIKDLIAKYDDLEQRFESKCKEFDNEVQTRSIYQSRANDATTKLTDIRHKMDVNSFAIAIIDGDGAVFRDDWIRKGEDGGAMAAHQLRDDIKKHLKEAHPDVNIETWHIMVQVVLNLEGLSRKLFCVDLAKSMSELSAFARGFSRAQGLFSFIDVGKGKEQADFKVRETLRLMVHNLQCKHIIFGPCHDKGYIVELRPYQLETSILNKITLLETTQPPREFGELAFRRVKFNDVFRSELLPEGWLPPTPPPSTSKPAPITPSSVNKAINYSTTASSWTSTLPFVNSFKKPVATPVKSTKASPRKFYFVNASGQRVDGPLPQADPYSEQRFKDRCEEEGSRKPCNRYHLHGICEENACLYYHGKPLSPGEQLILRIKARGSLCNYKSACKSIDCYWGHNCKFQKCQKLNCAFVNTHGIDLTPAEKVYEDGSREVLSP
ncbi:hypothetical protein F4813DRAFT_362064 [Daldinia decipiens]|uniref:uncharacterized protein n=1 Tax=Daldinia decipiens TaxID=326647 RepID=UPI0020C51C8F|nr:uncharacterized protein F4813DRAFT_362064 [Daldinia decipiens]KAI1656859.1 hypothetical protein F4813DRAFT_362064 [Daldinia decipiens]